MYADDTVIYVHAKTKAQAAAKLSDTMVHVRKWLTCSQLNLNVNKTVCMFFSKSKTVSHCEPNVCVSGEVIQTVTQFKYLGIILDSTLSFKHQVRKVVQITKYNRANFRYIRNCLTTPVAKLYMNTMIIPHLTYCMTSWTQACSTTLRPILSLHKQALKVLDKKPKLYHHCNILNKYNILSWENILKHSDAWLIFKIINGKAPPLCTFIQQKSSSSRTTRSALRGDCVVPLGSSSFGQLCFSVRASKLWNQLPVDIRNSTSHHTFTHHLKG